MQPDAPALDEPAQPRWQPLNSRQRRVFGVLVEKAKTTPENYPMSLNALTSGCNQKNNRSPLMSLEPEDVEEALEALRKLGAIGEVQGSGRVAKYRHYAYDWLGVDKAELAVMTELLLRGEQTVGELRGRAARMEPIGDLGELRPILDSLKDKGLLLTLSPEGRGQMVTHNLYLPNERPAGASASAPLATHSAPAPSAAPPIQRAPTSVTTASPVPSGVSTAGAPASGAAVTRDMFAELEVEVAELRAELARVRDRVRQLEEQAG